MIPGFVAASRQSTAFFPLKISGALTRRRYIIWALLWVTVRSWAGEVGTLEEWLRMKPMIPQGYVCQHTTGPINVDGKLDEPDWQSAPWTPDFQDIEGSAKPKPRFRTRAKMLWDDQYFYVAAELEEPHIWGTLTQHDSVIFRDNDFEVFIDPNGDSHEYYEFEMNALNTGWDLLLRKPYKDGGPAQNEWEIPGLKTAVHIEGTLNNPADTDKLWTVEIAFPWKVLGEYAHRPAPPEENDQWRVDFSRVEWQIRIVDGRYEKLPGTKEDNWIWSPPGIVDMHRPEKWGYVQFTRQPAGRAKFIPDPSMPARNALQEIYYAQRDYQTKNKRWASSPGDLVLSPDLANGLTQAPTIKLTANGYEASADLRLADGRTQRWHIRQDALIWPEPLK
jgi:hypothetical protein